MVAVQVIAHSINNKLKHFIARKHIFTKELYCFYCYRNAVVRVGQHVFKKLAQSEFAV